MQKTFWGEVKNFFKYRFDFTITWGNFPKVSFAIRDKFYCYVFPQRSVHWSPLYIRSGHMSITQVDYYWLNIIVKVDYKKPLNTK